MKILIIEDEPSLRELIQRSLEKERYVVEAAADFQSGLRKIEDYDYDCVLLDIMLPDGNGLNLLEQLKKMRKRENVIIISAKDSLTGTGCRRLSAQTLSPGRIKCPHQKCDPTPAPRRRNGHTPGQHTYCPRYIPGIRR